MFTNSTTKNLKRLLAKVESNSIVNKYADHPVISRSGKLPVMSNRRMNSYLKELADVSGITKELTFHCARRTFATTVTLTNGVPIETVSKMPSIFC